MRRVTSAFLVAGLIWMSGASVADAEHGKRTVKLGAGVSLVVSKGTKVKVMGRDKRIPETPTDERRLGGRVRLAIRGGSSATLRYRLPETAHSQPLDVVEAMYLVRAWKDGGKRWVVAPSRVNQSRTTM